MRERTAFLTFGLAPSDLPQDRRYTCGTCGALLRDRREDLRNAGRCEACARARAIDERRSRLDAATATLPERFRDASFGPPLNGRVGDQRAIAAALKALPALVTSGCTVVLHGRRREGKTTLAAALYNAVLERARGGDASALRVARSARFSAAWELGEARFRHALGDGEAPLIEAGMEASLLLLDDLGKEARRGRDSIAHVLQARWAAARPTIVTTELDGPGVAMLYTTDVSSGEYLQGRLFESPAVPVVVGGR